MQLPVIEKTKGRFRLSTDPSALDLKVIHHFLSNSYWAKNIPMEVVMQSVENSLCFGIYNGKDQVGFARIITDYSTFAYLADVFIIESFRGKGLSKWIMECILSHPNLQGLRRWVLATRDAHGLYARYDFKPLLFPDRFMELHDADVYKK